jgi:hypothetical protein
MNAGRQHDIFSQPDDTEKFVMNHFFSI